MKYRFLFLFLLVLSSSIAQTKTILKPGVRFNETITYFIDSVKTGTFTLPDNSLALVYKFNAPGGGNDNYDSVRKVVDHVYRLHRYFSPGRKPSRIICLIFVKKVDAATIALRNQVSNWNKQLSNEKVNTERVAFNFIRPWTMFLVKDSAILPNSFLNLQKMSIIDNEGVLQYTSPLQTFNYNGKKGTVKGKLLTEKQGKKVPVANAMVSMVAEGKHVHDSVLTDGYGDFELGMPEENVTYDLIVKSNNKEIDNIILASQGGQEISRLNKVGGRFEYKLIPAEIVVLTEMNEPEDITLTFKKFKARTDNILSVNENIHYGLGQYKIEEPVKKTLDKVVQILKENPGVIMEVVSHTDAQGEDKENQNLSEKRSASVIEYFVSKGIAKERLKAIGKGESEIRNRCSNGVDCSDKEHEYNRRTEFRFTKS
jgi:outer membrane protein OmpA-like peptidoglycan-associated protein